MNNIGENLDSSIYWDTKTGKVSAREKLNEERKKQINTKKGARKYHQNSSKHYK